MNPLQVTAGKSSILLPSAQPVVQAALYATGNAVGGLLTFLNAGQAGIGAGNIRSVRLLFKSIQTLPFDVLFFNSNPSGSTITDRNAANIVAADLPALIGVAPISAYSAFSTTCVAEARNLDIPFNVDTLYAAIIARGGPTFASTSDVLISLGVSKD